MSYPHRATVVKTSRAWLAFCERCSTLLTRMLDTDVPVTWDGAMAAANEHISNDRRRKVLIADVPWSHGERQGWCRFCTRFGWINQEGRCRQCR